MTKPVEQYEMLRHFRELLQWRLGDAIILGEANVLPGTDLEYFGDQGERLQMMFNFQVNQHLFYALATGETAPLIEALEATRPRPATAQWGMFLRNHDELDLGRLTPQQRAARLRRVRARRRTMQLYDRGIRRRLAPMLGGDRRRLELAYSLMLTLPGTPVLRYGDEIGDGRRPEPAGAHLRADADAVVGRAARRLHDRGEAGACRSSPAARTATST